MKTNAQIMKKPRTQAIYYAKNTKTELWYDGKAFNAYSFNYALALNPAQAQVIKYQFINVIFEAHRICLNDMNQHCIADEDVADMLHRLNKN